MIDQKGLDDVADDMVAAGIRVTYKSLRKAFQERNRVAAGTKEGTSHSPRDIQDPFADWKRRRRYKPHLARHDITEEADKAVARSLDALRKAAGRLPPEMPPMADAPVVDEASAHFERMMERLEKRLDAIAAENSALRRDLAARPVHRGGKVIRKGRKSGVFDSTSRHFWNQLMLVFQAHIKANGPKPLEDLLALIDQDSHDLAAAAFEAIDEATLREKLAIRVGRDNYFRLEGGLYHLLPPEPKKPKAKAARPSEQGPRTARRARVTGNG